MPDLIGHLVQKDSETVRDTLKIVGIASSFPIKMRLVVLLAIIRRGGIAKEELF